MSWLPWADLPPSSLLMDFSQMDSVLVRGPGDATLRSRLLSSFWTFSRASAATRVNAQGQIESVSNNVPRIDFDPVTLQPRGLQIEGQRTNLIANSEGASVSSVGAQLLPIDPALSALGPQLVADPELNSPASWVIDNPATTTIAGGVATFTSAPNNARICPAVDVVLEQNRLYRVSCGVSVSAGTINLIHDNGAAGLIIRSFGTGASVPASEIFYVIGTGNRIAIRTNAVTSATVQNLSVVEVIGGPQIASPSAIGPARKHTEHNTTGVHWIAYSYACTAATTYTVSVYLKAAERSVVGFFGAGNAPGACVVDLTNGAILSNSTSGLLVVPAGDGWWRVSYQVTTTTTGSTLFYIQLWQGAGASATASYTGDGTSGVFVYGPQSELGNFVSSYIPTTGSQVTRVAERAEVTGGNFSDFYRQDEGTFLVEARQPSVTTVVARMLEVSDGSTANTIQAAAVGTGTQAYVEVANASALEASQAFGSFAAGSAFRTALAYRANDLAAAVNAGAVVADASVNVPTVSQLNLGTRAIGASPFWGTIRRLQYWPNRLTNAQLQLISGAQPTSIATGTAAGGMPLTGTASGLAIAAASAFGSLPLDGTAAGIPIASASAAASLPLEGTALADLVAAAAASAMLPLAGSGAGAAIAAAQATGVLPLGGTALANLVADAAAIGLIPLAGTAFADLVALADARGALPLSGAGSLRMFRPTPKIRFTVPIAPRRFTVEASPRRFRVPPAAR